MFISQLLTRAVQTKGDCLATICAGRERTYKEFALRVQKFAGALRGYGITGGERVAILALNSDRYLEFYYATPWAGGVFVPVNTRLAVPEFAYWLNDSGSEILLVDDAFAGAVPELRKRVSSLREVIYIGDGDTPAGMLNYEELVAAHEPVPDAGRGYDDLAGLFYTGGTTGVSKGVMLSHTNFVVNTLNAMPCFNFKEDARWLHVAPMFHIADGAAVFGTTMGLGVHVFIPGFTPKGTMEAVEKYRITNTLLVPTMVNMVVNDPEIANYDMSSLKDIIYGASPMPEAVIMKALEVLPEAGFTHAYGQTECAPLVTFTGPEFHVLEGPNAGRFKSAGRPIYAGDVRIFDENDEEVPPGTVGQVCVRGANVMLGYWNKPEQTAEALKGGWMHSGDGGYMDEQGFVYIVDRVKDMIISGGENVYSAEVENAVYQHPAVAECAVIGIPHETWGEQVHAVVRLHEGKGATETEIIEFSHSLIAGFKCPRSIDFVTDPLPLSGAGKILKTELRKPYWSGKEKQVS
ncbi:long-chain-fatty-acid--CoA ligase [Sneathiella chungangensis]|uniref:3-methylmercaptopropionyl-CoA ligase n=1 Tax=Sneathiella chungangensis TaxID=1418234 RepID=A0A845MAK4_9PROT|nr:long-chain-fatty-acid--CoA ligase [Sneathiella chungangensis]MZR21308.1 long-chain-fatty-acid--CoA ligase [Sneathiella chungangensis]